MIDQSRLDELANDFGEEDLAEIIEVFLTETWEVVDGLETKAGAMDAQEQREQFHFLKGCARNIGAVDFADMCEHWEHTGDSFKASDYQAVKSAFQAVCDELAGRGLRLSA